MNAKKKINALAIKHTIKEEQKRKLKEKDKELYKYFEMHG